MTLSDLLSRGALGVASLVCMANGAAFAAPTQFTFTGVVVTSRGDGPPVSCEYFCDLRFPSRGSPMSFVLVLDQSAGTLSESNPSGTGTSTKHKLGGLSSVDFGLGPDLRTSDFYLRVVDDEVANSAPDRLYIIRDERTVSRQVPEYWFNVEFDSDRTSFLAGPGLPVTLDLSLTLNGGNNFGPPRGSFNMSRNGLSTEGMSFEITGVEIAQVIPEPSNFSLLLSGLGIVGLAVIRRRMS